MDVEAASLGAHCRRNWQPYGICSAIGTLIGIILISQSFDTLEPTEYGLLRNGITGVVDMSTVYSSGRYCVGPFQRFIHFPRNYLTLSFGNRSGDDQAQIRARTGADTTEVTSTGGQPVGLSISFQYQLRRERVVNVYQLFGENWEGPYLRFAQQALTNVAQTFTPRAFWTQRRHVEAAMLRAVNATLVAQGHAFVRELQLRAVSFQSSYEQTITDIQLQEQLRVTKSYQLEVTRVVKEVDLLQSEADATVRYINASAAREAAVIEGEANANALQREQLARAAMYRKLREHLGWSSTEFLQYIKMKALNAQPQSNVVVGVDAVGDVMPSAGNPLDVGSGL